MQSDRDLEGGRLTLQLLDAAQGHTIQTWHFEDCQSVKIGRASDSDITLADSRVSRLHVELKFEDGKWDLHSLGRNGTSIDGEKVSESRLRDGAVFQLGPDGPTFKFTTMTNEDSSMVTIDNIDPTAFDFLTVDEQQKAAEVQQIVETDAFRELQQRARRLRGEDPSTSDTEF